jgi:hypothetical protein
MVIPRPAWLLLIVASLVAVAPSCVESRHPLSDEKTSLIDQRLIGTWRLPDDPTVWEVRKSGQVRNALEVTIKERAGTGKGLLFTTTIKSKSYLSFKELDGDPKKKPEAAGYQICQYVFSDDGTLEVRAMEPDAIVKAISDKRLGGETVLTKRTSRSILGLLRIESTRREKRPFITDQPENIARYLERHANECYPAKSDLVLTFKRQK